MRLLVTSTRDPASQTIKKALIEDFDFTENGDNFDGNPILSRKDGTLLVTSSRDMVETNHLDEHFDSDVYIFCSRHRAESGKPALLTHSTGNLSPEALFGGTPHSLSISIASLVSTALKVLFREREKRGLEMFDVTMEATHHGPTSMNTPLLFVELGSNEEYWLHEDGARAVATAAMECVHSPLQSESFIGFGGTHYVSKFNKLVLEKEILLGHIAPKYSLTDIPASVIEMMVSRSAEKVKGAIIDWKGTNQIQREH
ncbi:MAG: D-aminoacyl-tRNA deacylase [Candidatus Thorarchaeota archaeon]